MTGPVNVQGLRELQAAFAHADNQLKRSLRVGLREVAEPVRTEAEHLAQETIRRIGPRWFKMRTGVTRKLVYVAPRQKGTRGRGPQGLRRGQGFAHPPFSDTLMDRAMEPALERHRPQIEARVEHLIDEISNGFNHGAV